MFAPRFKKLLVVRGHQYPRRRFDCGVLLLQRSGKHRWRYRKVGRAMIIRRRCDDPVDAVATGNVTVVLMLVPYKQGDQQRGRQPEGQPGNIDNGEAPAPAKAAEGGIEITTEHSGVI